jgi:hypothetical protein
VPTSGVNAYPASFNTDAVLLDPEIGGVGGEGWYDNTDAGDTSVYKAGVTHQIGDFAQWIRSLAQIVKAHEQTLGINPQGLYAPTVRERFEIGAYKNQSCRVATVAALPAGTYANGSAGVGATFTATATGAWAAIEGVTLALGDRILVKNQATPAQNGIYTVTTLGAVGVAMVLTRAIDADTSTKIADCRVLIDQGTTQGDTEWGCTATAPTMGTTALPWKRTSPIYGHGNPRFPWDIAASTTQVIMSTVPRALLSSTAFSLAVAATQYLIGGIVVPAGRTVTNINYIATVAGAAPTVDWLALARQSDRVVQAHTANSVAAPTINVVTTRALTAPWTPSEDTPVWIIQSVNIATTARQIVAGPAQIAAINLLAPAMAATNGVAPTTTLPTDGTTVITAATVGATAVPLFWLT